jgi:hypothetical protein
VRDEELSLVAVAELLPLSYRQCKRLWRRYQEEGDAGLVHRLRGRPSSRRIADATHHSILELYRTQYEGFGPTLAAEKLAQRNGQHLDAETLRRWLITDGQWQRRRRHRRHRQRRERKPHCGELIQIDGSEHDWFEGRGPRAVLMVMIDDATNRTYARFYEAEDTRAAFDLFGRYYDRYGLPQALYADLDSIYRVNPPEATAGLQPPLTQFGRAMNQLSVRIIPAYSPQAKGRVERRHGVFQDRLVKELRLAGLQTIAAANVYLDESFLPELNTRFTVVAAQSAELHRKLPRGVRLDEVLCWEEERIVARDWTLSWEGRCYQIQKQHAALSLVGRRVVVRELLDGRRQLLYRGAKRHWHQLPVRPTPTAPPPAARPAVAAVGRYRVPGPRRGPSATHPWRRWGIAAGSGARRAGPSAPATDRVSLQISSPQDAPGEGGSPGERLAINTPNKKPGRTAANVGGCGGRRRRRDTNKGTLLSS